MNIIQVDSSYFNKPNIDQFVDIVYNNFSYLTKYTKLGHSKEDIKKLYPK